MGGITNLFSLVDQRNRGITYGDPRAQATAKVGVVVSRVTTELAR